MSELSKLTTREAQLRTFLTESAEATKTPINDTPSTDAHKRDHIKELSRNMEELEGMNLRANKLLQKMKGVDPISGDPRYGPAGECVCVCVCLIFKRFFNVLVL